MSCRRIDSGYQTMLVVAFLLSYVTLAGILGGIDTLRNDGTDRIINSELDILYVLTPLLVVGAIITLLHIRDRTCSEED